MYPSTTFHPFSIFYTFSHFVSCSFSYLVVCMTTSYSFHSLLFKLFSHFFFSPSFSLSSLFSVSLTPFPPLPLPQAVCVTASKFLAHLVNQMVLHEIVALELLTLLLEEPTDDSVEVAVGFIKVLSAVPTPGVGVRSL